MNINEALAYISGFDRLGKPVTDLNRMIALLTLLGNPHKDLKYIHIAGTNGKGSVAEMCSEILVHAGYRVGKFISPYITHYCDRIQVNNENINFDSLCEIVSHVKIVLEDIEYKTSFSQFEISTAIAFIYFKKMRCDVVVLETGIGGRLDCTNVIESPLVSIITSISHDHDKILGFTLKEVAYHKSGIIKKKSPCVLSANNTDEVVDIVKRQCEQCLSPLVIPEINNLHVFKSDILGSDFYYNSHSYSLKMSGSHQILNATAVIEAMKFICDQGFSISYDDIYSGINSARVQARGEVLSQNPLIILDGAHNPAGMRSLTDIIKKADKKQCIAIIGMIKEKNIEESISQLAPFVSDFICVDGFAPNAVPAEELVRVIKSFNKNAFSVYDIDLAVKEAVSLVNDNGLLVICGSLFLASVARKIFVE